MKIKEIYSFLNEIAPFETSEPWDNSGILIGSENSDVNRILLSLDVNDFVINEAIKKDADLIVSHHPIIFSPLKNINENSVVFKAIKNNVSVISSHTCLDKADFGVNDCLAEVAGLKNIEKTCDDFLKIGETNEMNEEDFAELLKKNLNSQVTFNKLGKTVKKVAFCSGAGGEYYALAKELNADALLTGEAKYHEFVDATELGITIFSAGHFETEVVVLPKLAKILQTKFKNIEIIVSEQKNNIKKA